MRRINAGAVASVVLTLAAGIAAYSRFGGIDGGQSVPAMAPVVVSTQSPEASAPTAAAGKLAIESQELYFVQLGSFGDIVSADNECMLLTLEDVHCTVYETGSAYKLFTYASCSRSEAEKVEGDVEGKGRDAYVKRLTMPEVELEGDGAEAYELVGLFNTLPSIILRLDTQGARACAQRMAELTATSTGMPAQLATFAASAADICKKGDAIKAMELVLQIYDYVRELASANKA